MKSGSTDTLGFKEKRKGCSLQLNPAAPHQPPSMTRHSQPLKFLHVIKCPTLHHADLVFHQLPAERRGQLSAKMVPSAPIASFDPGHLTSLIPSTQPRLFPLSPSWKSTRLSPTQYPPALLAEAHRKRLTPAALGGATNQAQYPPEWGHLAPHQELTGHGAASARQSRSC